MKMLESNKYFTTVIEPTTGYELKSLRRIFFHKQGFEPHLYYLQLDSFVCLRSLKTSTYSLNNSVNQPFALCCTVRGIACHMAIGNEFLKCKVNNIKTNMNHYKIIKSMLLSSMQYLKLCSFFICYFYILFLYIYYDEQYF